MYVFHCASELFNFIEAVVYTYNYHKMPNNEDWEEYVNDSRTICKYGARCYQKNPDHHRIYKHPPKNIKIQTNSRDKRKFSPYAKKEPKKITPTADDDQSSNYNVKVDQVTANEDNTCVHQDSPIVNNTSDHQKILPLVACHEDNEIKIPDTVEYYAKNPNHNLYKDIFLVDMPEDFYRFYECLNEDGSHIEKLLSSVNLELIGPYDLLLGKLPILDEKELYLVHWRFFYDPPEFQAVLKRKGPNEFHIGYFRDNPNDKPVFVASNDSAKDCRLTPLANNIFAAVCLYLENEKKKSPFVAMACQKIMDKLNKAAKQYNYSMEKYDNKERRAQTVAKTLHGAGIVVPYNRKTQLGYRHLTETDANLEKLFEKLKKAENQEAKDNALSELQPVITYANIAVDECDFGTGLEAGIDLFCSGLKDLEPSALACLTSAYNLLNREAFSKIIIAHLKYRRKGPKLSLVDFK